MKPPHPVPRPRDYLRILALHWVVIVVATVASAGAGYVATLLEKTEYTASVDLFGTVAGDSGVRAAYQGGLGATARMSTYGTLATSARVLVGAGQQLKSTVTASEISVTLVPQSVVVRLTATNHDAARAVEVVNAVAASLARASQLVETTPDGPAAELVPVGPARGAQKVATEIIDPILIGAGIGLLLSFCAVAARELLGDRLRHRSELTSFVDGLSRTPLGKAD